MVSFVLPVAATTNCLTFPDPENYAWQPLDDDLLARLTLRRYVSLSKEKKLNIPAQPIGTRIELFGWGSSSPRDQSGSESANEYSDYLEAQIEAPHIHAHDQSIFEANTPGALTLEEVYRDIPLGEWRIQLQGSMIQLKVRGPITSDMELVETSALPFTPDVYEKTANDQILH